VTTRDGNRKYESANGKTKTRRVARKLGTQSAWLVGVAILSIAVVPGYLVSQMQNRLERIQGQLDRATARVVHLERTAATLTQELEETDLKRNVLQGQLDSASSKIGQVGEIAKAAEASHENWQSRFDSLRGELESAKKLAEQAKEGAAESTKHTASLQAQLDEANASRHALHSELASAHSSVQQLRSELDKTQSELVDMRSRLTSKQDELEDARKKLKLGALGRDSGHPSETEKLKNNSLDPNLPLTERTELSADPAAEERDYLIRTLVFEASGETEIGMAAVAHVILNRKKSGRWGDKIRDVVTYPQQFEPWMTRKDDIQQLSPSDPRYLKAAVIADGVLAGLISDPTAGATHFLNPIVVRQRRGGSLPSWADADGQPFGRHVFYSPERNRTVPQHADLQGHPSSFAGAG
jgi:spore germination cell wall hydrolase CwlJ-like protein/FtsZ-binding cell division protein ZapB